MKVTVMDLLIEERKLLPRLLLGDSRGLGPSVEVLPLVQGKTSIAATNTTAIVELRSDGSSGA